jgi:hypothetical protein
MYADDVVILSTSKQGLQNCVNKLETFTAESEMSVNIKKTKVLVFNKAGRIKNIETCLPPISDLKHSVLWLLIFTHVFVLLYILLITL